MQNSLGMIGLSVLSMFVLAGCGSLSQQQATISDPSFKPQRSLAYHLELDAETDGTVSGPVIQAFDEQGYRLSHGKAHEPVPAETDVLVTFEDRWYWDITTYLLELRLHFRDPETRIVLAEGQVQYTSAVRKSPLFMARKALQLVMDEAGMTHRPIVE